jgi:hypothetical protein
MKLEETEKVSTEGIRLLWHPSEKQHYKYHMKLGRILPSTKSQALYMIKERLEFDVFLHEDALDIDKLMKKHGKVADFSYTKRKRFLRLNNVYDFYEALAEEYGIKL